MAPSPPPPRKASPEEKACWHALSALDGRYAAQIKELGNYFSEYETMRYRVAVEIEYFIALVEEKLPELVSFPKKHYLALRNLYLDFQEEFMQSIKRYEGQIQHDVKAVEYFLADKFKEMGLEKYRPFIHFGLTSQDINNTAQPLSMREAHVQALMPAALTLSQKMEALAQENDANTVMLARTHGQPATSTHLKKELYVFITRYQDSLGVLLKDDFFAAKFGGAAGEFNAHYIAYPKKNWMRFRQHFIRKFGLQLNAVTTQIEPYDRLAAYCHAWMRVATLLMDYAQDMWWYLSMHYFKMKVRKGEVGSSTMPHKVNPIHFENAEGNLHIARALLGMFAQKLPISRLQRDLSDSTVLRNIGVALGHMLLAIKGLTKGTEQLSINKKAIETDLKKHDSVVVLEAWQTLLRKAGKEDAYECIRDFTRGKDLSQEALASFITQLDVSEAVKASLRKVRAGQYVDFFAQEAQKWDKESVAFHKEAEAQLKTLQTSSPTRICVRICEKTS